MWVYLPDIFKIRAQKFSRMSMNLTNFTNKAMCILISKKQMRDSGGIRIHS